MMRKMMNITDLSGLHLLVRKGLMPGVLDEYYFHFYSRRHLYSNEIICQ